ncbi:MAG: ferrous iron transport protein B [Ruminococcaceae bacterium]|nr:ferrous iron transport protein B [Oscillospiraceae bacterium]
MGLTNKSVGKAAIDTEFDIQKRADNEYIIALAGNPNVGKSTIFNGLTGMNQHTGNWPGKTVASAKGYARSGDNTYIVVDLPGTYSLASHSPEEEIARDFICFGRSDAVLVVCDATCLERNLNLVLQTLEITPNVIVCVNLLDEAGRKSISVDLEALSKLLGVPVIGSVGRKKKSLNEILSMLDLKVAEKSETGEPCRVRYPALIENSIDEICAALGDDVYISRYVALRLLEEDKATAEKLAGEFELPLEGALDITKKQIDKLKESGIYGKRLSDMIVGSTVRSAERICAECVKTSGDKYKNTDHKLDKIFTGKITAYPIMILFFAFIFWLTITGANYPSNLLSELLFSLEDKIDLLCDRINMPYWIHGVLVSGAYRVLAWVVSVMLPPMAIFFPLFTLLEDAGYLPRIAYNLDKPLAKCRACGKQALTMCMGFGCNAAGVVGCRIIDSKRERLLAILTNAFVPCNGRFPTLIAIISMFFVYSAGNSTNAASLVSTLLLTGIIILSVAMTLIATRLLSSTILRGMPSSFVFELPPYRRPQIGKVIVRSIFDRTLFVLARSAAVAAPAGAVIWILANINMADKSLLLHVSDFLEPFGKIMGLDGAILLGFILGFPANEIVLPIIIMVYTASTSLTDVASTSAMREIFISNGWTSVTALNVMLFSLMHWPCSTTVLTVRKETGSMKWTLLSMLIPTVFGVLICIAINTVASII